MEPQERTGPCSRADRNHFVTGNDGVTEHIGTRFPAFYRTSPAPCPYIPGRMEQKVFTRLSGEVAKPLNDALTHAGFRRSQNIAYKPSCEGCSACISVRIVIKDFSASESLRRVASRNADLASEVVDAWATDEQFRLMRQYLDSRHAGGGMSEMSMFDYVAMVEDSAVNTHLVEYRRTNPDGTPGKLTAIALTDVLSDGLSMVYSFYDVSEQTRSLGTFMVLDHIAQARKLRLPYVYLGYWISGCRKMNYKSRFQPLEARGPEGWVPFRP
ncbi:MAG TPA: arginyltransferase [Alphaproteobacteria bacterium]|nr:arginyltransferase [Alphaproteobacteria bacterium]HAJ47807.1 arginyltransferase [Alphaproteobacteria bacterium]